MPSYVYHVTSARNLFAIEAEGLQPSIGERSAKMGETTPATYCFDSLEALEDGLINWLGDEFAEDEAIAIIAVNTDGLQIEATKGAEFEVVSHDPIPPSSLTVLTRDIDDIPDLSTLRPDDNIRPARSSAPGLG